MHLHSSPLTVPKANSTGIEDKESFMMKKMTIANALAPHLSEDRLEEALIIWEHKYAHQPTFALQRFNFVIITCKANVPKFYKPFSWHSTIRL